MQLYWLALVIKSCAILILPLKFLALEEMDTKFLKMIFFILVLTTAYGQINYITFNVNPVSLTRANFYLNILGTQVQTYNWIYCNKIQLYSTVINVVTWLKQVRSELPCGNTLQGSGNMVQGLNNVVIGNKNSVRGVNNWVFVSNYKNKDSSTTIQDSILAIGNYKIDLTKISSIQTNPSQAISKLDSNGYNDLCSKNVAAAYFFTS